MKTTLEMIKIMQAYVDGKQIEAQCHDGSWQVTDTPRWEWHTTNYRIKERKIDWQPIIDNEIDCMFACSDDAIYQKLKRINLNKTFRTVSDQDFFKCVIRQNHIHFWIGTNSSPLPEGLIVTLYFTNGQWERAIDYTSRCWLDVIGFEVHGLDNGWSY